MRSFVSATKASKVIGVDKWRLTQWLVQNPQFEGVAIIQPTRTRNSYWVNLEKLRQVMGWTKEEMKKRCERCGIDWECL